MERHFTLSEARGLLPRVARLLRQAVEFKRDYQKAEHAIQAFAGQVTLMGGMQVDRSRIREAKDQRDGAAQRLQETVEGIREIGAEVKDLETGLIDFPALYRGREVYLCWKLGESDIEHWHGIDEGFAGRKPIDQDFIDHHEGGRTQ